MARAPFQVLVLPYRRQSVDIEYAIFRRADNGVWQGIAGGGEDHETPHDAAVREMQEEAGITTARLLELHAVGTVGVEHFRQRHAWDPALRQIPEYAFGVAVDESAISLSPEHLEVAWLTFEEALARLLWESNRIALRELHYRLSAAPGTHLPRSARE
jgi:dATP pyrophosphohydrolase